MSLAMIRNAAQTNLIVFTAFLAVLPAQATIFGVDQRREVAISDARARTLAKATALMVSPVFVGKNAAKPGFVDLEFPTLSASADICTDQRFAHQPVSPVTCTGFLIAPDLMLTAGHCAVNFGEVSDEANAYCTSFMWMFDFQTDASGQVRTKDVPETRFYGCKKILYAIHEYDYDKATDFYGFKRDFAIVQLDRPVLDRQPLEISKADVRKGVFFDMIGYPNGLPAKITGPAPVTDVSDANFMRANLDSFAGNSGSPVFASNSSAVSGILVRTFPDGDYVPAEAPRTCQRVNTCDEDAKGCLEGQKDPRYLLGAHVQRINDVLAVLRARKIPFNISQ